MIREEIMEGTLKLIGDIYRERYGKEMVITEEDTNFVQRLFEHLHSKGVVIKGKGLAASHPHLSAYYTTEPLIKDDSK